MRAINAAERQLLDAAHRAAVASKLAAIAAHFTALLSSAEQQIIAHVQGKIGSIDPNLTPQQRHAALERLRAEQEAALAQLRQSIGLEQAQARRSARAGLVAGHRVRKQALGRRHVAARTALSRFGGVSVIRSTHHQRQWPPVRRVVAKLLARSRRRSVLLPTHR
jgi:hypothetical protein